MLSNIFKGLSLVFLMAGNSDNEREGREGELGTYFFRHEGSVGSAHAPSQILEDVLDAYHRGDSNYQSSGSLELVDMNLIGVRSGKVDILPDNRAKINEIARSLGFQGPYREIYDLDDPRFVLRSSGD